MKLLDAYFARSFAVWLLKLVAHFDESIAHQAPQSLHPHWCNLHNRECLYRCKQVCLDADLPRGAYASVRRQRT